jgi:CheY-like chemotaxis protein
MKTLKILIAEDDDTSGMLLTELIEVLSREILYAKTGLAAVEVCRTNPDFDLILMDIQMPEMNGYDATRQIRKFNKDVIIIAQTAFALSGEREKAKEAGCDDYISKPIKQGLLIDMIKKHFNTFSNQAV